METLGLLVMAVIGEGDNLSRVLKTLIESKVAEERVKALENLCKSYSKCSSSEELNILEVLVTCWQEASGSVLRDCKWRTSICRVGSSRLPLIQKGSQIFTQYVQLATKACAWCSTCLSKQEVFESKSKKASPRQDALLKLLVETNSFSVATYSVAVECSFLMEKQVISSVASLLSESLSLIKVLCLSNTSRIDLQGADMLKVGVELLQAALRVVAKVNGTVTNTTVNSSTNEGYSDALEIITSVLRDLEELGTLTARVEWGMVQSAGGKNIALFNLSWRSCVAILTLSEGSRTTVTPLVDIKKFIARLISVGTYSLKLATQEWLSRPSSEFSVVPDTKVDFRKRCILVRFFASQVSKMCTFYPEQAAALRVNIVDYTLKFATLILGHNGEALPNHVVEILSEVAAPVVFGLLPSLLASGMQTGLKVELLQTVGSGYEPLPAVEDLGSVAEEPEKDLFLPLWNNSSQRGYLPNRVMVFLQLLESSENYEPVLMVEIANRLDWVLDSIAEDEVYAALVQVQIFQAISPEATTKSQLMYLWVVTALQKFIILASASSEAWTVIQEFLFKYALHSNTLCVELIKRLWFFIAKHSDEGLVQEQISALVSILRSVAAAEDAQQEALKRLAQLICSLVQAVPSFGASHLFSLVFHEDPFATESSSKIVSVLLQEGFTMGLLPEITREDSMITFLKHCLAAVKQFSKSNGKPDGREQGALWCLFHLLNQCEDYSVIEPKEMQEIKSFTFDAFLNDSRTTSNGHRFSGSVISPVLLIASFFLKRNVHPKTLQNILVKIEDLVKSTPQDDGRFLKVPLAEILSSLSSFEFPEVVDDPVSEALWYLYRTVLREQHWALVHCGLRSFGHFAECTPCNELWRFVPSDPGLASEVQESTQSGADMFMSTLKSYLEKETMCDSLIVSDTEIDLLQREAKKQRRSYFQLLQRKEREIPEEKTIVIDLDSMDSELRPSKPVGQNDRSKPDEVKTGILMLQEGFTLLNSMSTEWLSRSDAKLEEWRFIISQLAIVNKKLASL